MTQSGHLAISFGRGRADRGPAYSEVLRYEEPSGRNENKRFGGRLTELTEEQDTEDRTSPFSLFTNAESYWWAAQELVEANVRSVHPESPIRFLYYHAIELFLKSYLRLHGHTVRDLGSRQKFGHDMNKLTERAAELGLRFDVEDRHLFKIVAETDAVIRSRYHRTGAFHWPTIDGLDRVCDRLHGSIRDAMRAAGFPAR
jgi:hypothetical protein